MREGCRRWTTWYASTVFESRADPHAVLRVLDWTYDRAIEGVGGIDSARALADEYMATEGTLHERAERLIRWQVAKSSASGFLSGLGGAVTLPITIPANITSVMYVQLRMIGAIAHMGGHDVQSDRVRTLAYTCLLGNAAKDVVKEAGIQLGTRVTQRAIVEVSTRSLAYLNRRIGTRLALRLSRGGTATLGRLVPVVGGAVGAAFDGSTTYAVGRIARQAFLGT